jgi:hypothetical protein
MFAKAELLTHLDAWCKQLEEAWDGEMSISAQEFDFRFY